MFQVRIGAERIRSIGNQTDLLVCFNQEGFDLQHDTVGEPASSSSTPSRAKVTDEFADRSYEVPFSQIAEEAGGSRRGKNMVGRRPGLRTARHRHDADRAADPQALRAQGRRRRGEHRVAARPAATTRATNLPDVCNVRQADRARARTHPAHAATRRSSPVPCTPASPTSPATRSRRPPTSLKASPRGCRSFGGVAIQTEDEIAALASVLGASFTGAKAMTATSGPGLSLMSELIGLAGTAEIPAVIIDAQRAGPSTGMPTKTEQSDLNQARLRLARRGAARRDRADDGRRLPALHGRRLQRRRDLPGAGDSAFRPVALATASRRSTARISRRSRSQDRQTHRGRFANAPSNGDDHRPYKRYALTDRRHFADGDPRRARRVRVDRHRARRARSPGLHAGSCTSRCRTSASDKLDAAGSDESRHRHRPGAGDDRHPRLGIDRRRRRSRPRRYCASRASAPPLSTRACSAPLPVERITAVGCGHGDDRRARGQLHRPVRRMVRADCEIRRDFADADHRGCRSRPARSRTSSPKTCPSRSKPRRRRGGIGEEQPRWRRSTRRTSSPI